MSADTRMVEQPFGSRSGAPASAPRAHAYTRARRPPTRRTPSGTAEASRTVRSGRRRCCSRRSWPRPDPTTPPPREESSMVTRGVSNGAAREQPGRPCRHSCLLAAPKLTPRARGSGAAHSDRVGHRVGDQNRALDPAPTRAPKIASGGMHPGGVTHGRLRPCRSRAAMRASRAMRARRPRERPR